MLWSKFLVQDRNTIIRYGVTDGSGGIDTLDGGIGTDLISFGFTTDAITLDLSNTSSQATGNQGSLIVSNIEDIYGGYGNDTLTGNSSSNTIKGGFGSDTLFNLNFYTCFFICSICRNCCNYYHFSFSAFFFIILLNL